ncbi:MAG: helix-turn-helix transcriptional regulator [Clostridia bacterium]|nr:helix-turn-helix transcriptional regulator [Clostridia bacterium]
MSIGMTIKTLRRGADMTQETLAEHLCVSPQAISRWERDDALPDIMQLGPLANLFGVTTDYLLGVDVEKKKEKIDAIASEAWEKARFGHKAEAAAILREGLKQYPGEFKLMDDLGDNLWYMSQDDAYTKEECDAFRDECIALKEKILEGCTDDKIRNSAVQTLCFIYPGVGKRERAEELARSMPFMVLSREFLLPNVLEGDEKKWAEQHLTYDLIQHLVNRIGWKKRIALLELFFEDGDYGFYDCMLGQAHRRLAKGAAGQGEAEEAFAHLDTAADAALRFEAYMQLDSYTHTSAAFRGFKTGAGKGVSTSSPTSETEKVRNLMAKSEFDALRADPRFAAVEAKLNG